jgi:hypothetical protein
MQIDDTKIVMLRAKVQVAREEFDQASAYHEAWKPAAYDKEVHDLIGKSRATNTFLIIRQALRREMLMALMRIWDDDKRTPSLTKIANILDDKRVLDALANKCEADYAETPITLVDNSGEDISDFAEAMKNDQLRFARELSSTLRENAAIALKIIRLYGDKSGEDYETFERLKYVRDKHLAHREINLAVEPSKASTADEIVEPFYQDTLKVVRLLLSVVENVDYRPEDTAAIYARHAKLFWAGIRGEYTEGHPRALLKTLARKSLLWPLELDSKESGPF